MYNYILRQRTPASSKCKQLWVPNGLAGQSISRVSVPTHCTLSRRIGPVPWPNCENETALAPVGKMYAVKHVEISKMKLFAGTYMYVHRWPLQTYWREPKLPAGYISISSSPEVITHCAPDVVIVAYLNSTLTGNSSIHESNVTKCTPCCKICRRI